MPDLRSDIVGRVNRLALRPTDKNALLPLMEAISNSVHAITDLYANDARLKGRIDVRVLRDGPDEDSKVIGFEVEDNGVGFTDANYESFERPDHVSCHREAARVWADSLGSRCSTRSRWTVPTGSEAEWNRRSFDSLSDKEQIVLREPKGENPCTHRTTIRFENFRSPYEGRCPTKRESIEARIAAHFVPLFVAGNAPKVVVEDQGITDIEALFADSIKEQKTEEVVIGDADFPIKLNVWSLKCDKRMRFEPPSYHFAFIAGDSRSVIDYSLDEQLGLKLLDDEYVHVGCASGEYLDQNVNSERTAFTLEVKEVEEIKRVVARCAREFLAEYVEKVLEAKVNTAREIISENPQFLYMIDNLRTFAESLQPNAVRKEDIFLEMSLHRFRRQKRFTVVAKSIEAKELIDSAISEKVQEYKDYVTNEQKGALAEYVSKRKAVLDLFEKLLEYKDAEEESYNKEDAVHSLFCPMRINSGNLEVEDHNLWLLDDRLAFFNYFASDLELNKYTSSGSAERPDLAFFYDACFAWRETENTDTVVIVEFKKPMRTDYGQTKDPVQQVLGYVERLKTQSGVPDSKGRAIRGIGPSTAFHCYIVADITPQFKERIIGRFEKTPTEKGTSATRTIRRRMSRSYRSEKS